MKKDAETLQKFIDHCDAQIALMTSLGKTETVSFFNDLKLRYQNELNNL